MDERSACALLKQRFEAAGFCIADNVAFDEGGVRFDIDGWDAARRVGFEYVTREAGDDWDVDAAVIRVLAERQQRGELHILTVDEQDAPDESALAAVAAKFLAEIAGATAPVLVAPADRSSGVGGRTRRARATAPKGARVTPAKPAAATKPTKRTRRAAPAKSTKSKPRAGGTKAPASATKRVRTNS